MTIYAKSVIDQLQKRSEAYEFMEKRLNDYLQSLSLKENDDNEEQCLFKYHYIKELDKRGDMLHNEMDYLTKLPSVIADDIDFNNRNKHDILVIDSNIAAAEEEKKEYWQMQMDWMRML